jgi:signal transduction histidine kinase
VWNRGKEIAPETSGKLFEPFYTTREKGTGLGLAFVRDIARDHGGSVEVASESGETTFSIRLPAR